MVNKTLEHAKNKYTLIANVWKVFSILLEYCCKSNYSLMIQRISKEHQDTLEATENKLMDKINVISANEKKLQEDND
jgi:hypothetical protein